MGKKILIAVALWAMVLMSNVQAKSYSYVDMHLHYLNFVQQTQGFEAMLAKMDEQGVTNSVVFGMPYNIVVNEQAVNNPNYYLSDDSKVFWYPLTDILVMDDYLKLSPDQQRRIYPFLGGANTGNKNSAREMERVLQMYPGKFKGIGELMFRHDFLTWKAAEPAPLPNSAAADAIFKLAAKYDLPVIIHHNMTSLRSQEPIYWPELETALANNRQTKVIWAHAGQSYYLHVNNLTAILEKALAGNPNLYIDLSWVVLEQDVIKTPDSMKEWAKLLNQYPDRFMIGTDTVGSFENYNIRKYDQLLDLLDETTAQKVARGNFLRLIHEK